MSEQKDQKSQKVDKKQLHSEHIEQIKNNTYYSVGIKSTLYLNFLKELLQSDVKLPHPVIINQDIFL